MIESGPKGVARTEAEDLLSIVVPVCNEVDNIVPLAREVAAAMRDRSFELLFVDDGSTDGTAEQVRRIRDAEIHQIRLLRHSFRSGQSAAVTSGMRHARGDWVATLDGDGQNDPADIPKLLAALRAAGEDVCLPPIRLVMGHRAQRRDTWLKRGQSRVANAVRASLLGDGTPDTGCGIKVLHRESYLELPRFDHMHRFLPALYQRAGLRVISVPVQHRARQRGQSKYGLFDRLWVGIVDILGVLWLRRRFKPGLIVSEE